MALPEIPGVDWQTQPPCHEFLEREIPPTKGVRPIEVLPNFDNFWFVENFTLQIHPPSPPDSNTGSFNDIIGIDDLPTPQKKPTVKVFKDGLDSIRAHLRGTLSERSKRVFSFSNPARTWGFVIPGDYQCIGVQDSTIPEESNCNVAVQKLLNSQTCFATHSVLWGDNVKKLPISFIKDGTATE